MNGTGSDDKVLLVFRGNKAASSLNVASVNSEATAGNPTSQTVTSSGGTPPLVVLGGYGADTTLTPRTFSPAKDGEVNSSIYAYLAWKIYNSSPANVSIDMDDNGGANILQSCYIEMS